MGETVRIYFGVGGPNITSSFHVIGEIFDHRLRRGRRAGRAEACADDDGALGRLGRLWISSSMSPALYVPAQLSAVARIQQRCDRDAQGERAPRIRWIYSGQAVTTSSTSPRAAAIQTDAAARRRTTRPPRTKAERIERGERIYKTVCAACHQPDGEGIAGAFPPLAESDYLNADKRRAIGVVVHGLTGEIQVNGKSFNSVMPSLGLTDEDGRERPDLRVQPVGQRGARGHGRRGQEPCARRSDAGDIARRRGGRRSPASVAGRPRARRRRRATGARGMVRVPVRHRIVPLYAAPPAGLGSQVSERRPRPRAGR